MDSIRNMTRFRGAQILFLGVYLWWSIRPISLILSRGGFTTGKSIEGIEFAHRADFITQMHVIKGLSKYNKYCFLFLQQMLRSSM